jgi:hypothetical protein
MSGRVKLSDKKVHKVMVATEAHRDGPTEWNSYIERLDDYFTFFFNSLDFSNTRTLGHMASWCRIRAVPFSANLILLISCIPRKVRTWYDVRTLFLQQGGGRSGKSRRIFPVRSILLRGIQVLQGHPRGGGSRREPFQFGETSQDEGHSRRLQVQTLMGKIPLRLLLRTPYIHC